jgi:hypothetical protein
LVASVFFNADDPEGFSEIFPEIKIGVVPSSSYLIASVSENVGVFSCFSNEFRGVLANPSSVKPGAMMLNTISPITKKILLLKDI